MEDAWISGIGREKSHRSPQREQNVLRVAATIKRSIEPISADIPIAHAQDTDGTNARICGIR